VGRHIEPRGRGRKEGRAEKDLSQCELIMRAAGLWIRRGVRT